MQSRDDQIAGFWDRESATIQLLDGKGVADDKIFGYDWHWRAEEASDRHNPRCPATAWNKPLRNLHDGLSIGIMDLLPLPFVIIGGGCARRNFEKIVNGHFRAVEMDLIPPDGKLKF